MRTSRIELLIEGVPGAGNLLGNLLCAITGILDPQAATPATPSAAHAGPERAARAGRPAPRSSLPLRGPVPPPSAGRGRYLRPLVRIFSGIQPTGRKHLGNYIGGITQYVAGQDRGDPAIYCIVDLHSITVDYDPAELRERTLRHRRAADRRGPRPGALHPVPPGRRARSTPSCRGCCRAVTPLGELQRMHQFRDKSVAQRELVSAGLLFYPVLQAADVLAYRAHEVPVGEDQREHLELMRDVAERFNRRFGETLVVPEARIPTVGARIRDLQDPTKKMSTTAASPSRARSTCSTSPTRSCKKFKRAVTDSGTRHRRARPTSPASRT